MDSITLQQVIPAVFAEKQLHSDIWDTNTKFTKGRKYLVEAASGTGKTTLCSYLYGHRKDYTGSILFDKEDIRSLSISQWSDIRINSLSILFQDMKLFPELTARENVMLKNELTEFRSANEIEALFGALGITDKLDSIAGKLSIGQQQRVAFIRALCQPYDFIILDEPISHLDNANGKIMSEILFKEASAQGAGVIVTSIGVHFGIEFDQTLTL